MKQTLGKPEKLKSRKQIDQLFRARKFVTVSPIRLFYEVHAEDAPARPNEGLKNKQLAPVPIQAGFSCSKKFFKQAARRNRVKRLLREAYRKRKEPLWQLCQANGCRLSLFWLYGHKELPTQQEIEQKVDKLLTALVEKLQQRQLNKG
ncbi:ribonuclease P protein component [Arachidicoccus terrestris]|uniref:ribonuclease P protein component n=1 Tax=Arachidicoccus terrestris TaxID=2875539 RepID=UPI001CC55F42|nr:ribonuclease P protein component [Arachidicoccus terrestris]UAY55977.1 ribonuclease P protein component [Arachidicoccus terrestris]